jgi:hypothetical protein
VDVDHRSDLVATLDAGLDYAEIRVDFPRDLSADETRDVDRLLRELRRACSEPWDRVRPAIEVALRAVAPRVADPARELADSAGALCGLAREVLARWPLGSVPGTPITARRCPLPWFSYESGVRPDGWGVVVCRGTWPDGPDEYGPATVVLGAISDLLMATGHPLPGIYLDLSQVDYVSGDTPASALGTFLQAGRVAEARIVAGPGSREGLERLVATTRVRRVTLWPDGPPPARGPEPGADAP